MSSVVACAEERPECRSFGPFAVALKEVVHAASTVEDAIGLAGRYLGTSEN